jgi:FAS-associated factor 2
VQETLQDTLNTQSSSSPSRLPTAPRIVPSPNPEVNYRPGFPFNIILAPFSLATFVVIRLFRTFASFIPFLPQILAHLSTPNSARSSNRRALKPRDTAARFIREFEEEYGTKELPFREMGYAHLLDEAKRDLKYLLVIILSPEHDDMAAYVHDTLLAPEVMSFLRNQDNNIILWGGSVQDPEAYQITEAFRVTKFPYAALIANTPASRGGSGGFATSGSGMSIIAPLSGLLPPTEFLTKIRRAIANHAPDISRLQAERAERDASRSIREQQDSAYERSLARDRERAKQKKEEEARQKVEEEKVRKEEEHRERAIRSLQDWKAWRAARILPEPSADDTTAVRLSIRLGDGERAVRKFSGTSSVEEIYAFVECFDLLKAGQLSKEASKPEGFVHKYNFNLVSPMPRTLYESTNLGTAREVIGRSANLIVETIDEDEEE